MQTTLTNLIPIFLFFGLGLLLRRLRFADTSHAQFLLKFVFFITLPALVLLFMSEAPLSLEKLSLPFINIAVNLCCMVVTLGASRFMAMDRRTLGSMLVSTMIINNAFMFPFILAAFGAGGFADAILLDFGNGIITMSFTYALAFRYGPEGHATRTLITKTLQAPLLWALIASIYLSISSTELPPVLKITLQPLGQMTSPLILISLGIFFTPKFDGLKLIATTLSIRMVFGLLIGMAIAKLAGLEGTTFTVVALCSAAPVGFNALTFSSLAKLDTELTAEVLSLSILIGVFYIPLLMFLFQA